MEVEAGERQSLHRFPEEAGVEGESDEAEPEIEDQHESDHAQDRAGHLRSGASLPRKAQPRRHCHAAHEQQARQQVEEERSEEHTSERQQLMRSSYAVFCWNKKKNKQKRAR